MKGGLEDAIVVLENSVGGLTRFRKAVLATLCALKLRNMGANAAICDAPAEFDMDTQAIGAEREPVYFEKNFTKDGLLQQLQDWVSHR
jgi:hypothetical protein